MSKREGGETMIEETIRAVKEAEAKADETVAEAKRKADEILTENEKRIQALRDRTKADMAKAAREAKDREEADGRDQLLAADQESAKEADRIRAEAASKKEDAVDAVIRALI